MAENRAVVPFPRPRQADPDDAVRPLRPFYTGQMDGREPAPREWLIDGILLRGTLLILSGAPKIGKSLLAQQALASLAIGADFLGRATVQSRSYGLFCEDPQSELERRQLAILAHHDLAPADVDMEMSWDSRDGEECTLVTFDRFSSRPKFTRLWNNLWNLVEDEGIRVVGIDTAAAVFAGNEMARDQVTAFMRALQTKAKEIGGAVILNAHPNKSNPNGMASGTTAWLASARAGLSLGRPQDYDFDTGQPANIRVLRGLGSNYAAGITSERIEYQDGVFVPAEPDHRGKRGPLSLIEKQELRYRLLAGLKRIVLNGAIVPADEFDSRSLPARARRQTDPAICLVPLNELYRAQQELIDSGLAVRVKVGRTIAIRAHDGPYYAGEEPFIAPPAPPNG